MIQVMKCSEYSNPAEETSMDPGQFFNYAHVAIPSPFELRFIFDILDKTQHPSRKKFVKFDHLNWLTMVLK